MFSHLFTEYQQIDWLDKTFHENSASDTCVFYSYRLRTFDSGVKVLQSSTHSEQEVIKKTTEVVSGFFGVFQNYVLK